MWLDLKKQGIYVNLEDVQLAIISSDSGAFYMTLDDERVQHCVLTRDQRDMFVALHEEALDMDANVFHFDQDKPQFTMRLSGDDDEQFDVGGA